ncbi:MAG: tilS [Gammaproteobacteria bacterium]|jgi:tRNA(Ile)-lysidine synthase|nr:tilS [Gammaproteobacteria bacterium]
MAALLDCVKAFCLEQGLDKTYWLGYSGGLDSHVLLHLCMRLRRQYPLRLKAVHVHHGLSRNAQHWVAHCAKVCADLQIEFIQKSVNATALTGESPENTARQRRYEVFADLLQKKDILFTAHQQEDQAETVLLQLLRGAGPKGLSAMPVFKEFAAGFQARPLLSASRFEIEKYAESHQLVWIEDESNTNKNFTRNFLRHDVLPLLKQRWPTVSKTLARVAENCAEAQQVVETIAVQNLAGCYDKKTKTLALKKLRLLDAVSQRQVLRRWLEELGFPIPSAVKLYQIQHDFFHARSDRSPYMTWGNVELRRYQDTLYAKQCALAYNSAQIYHWDLTAPLKIPHVGVVSATMSESGGLRSDITEVSVRFRRGGERCYFPERYCHQLLKHLLQKWHIPPWERERLPLVFVSDILVAIPGLFLDRRYFSTTGRELVFHAS